WPACELYKALKALDEYIHGTRHQASPALALALTAVLGVVGWRIGDSVAVAELPAPPRMVARESPAPAPVEVAVPPAHQQRATTGRVAPAKRLRESDPNIDPETRAEMAKYWYLAPDNPFRSHKKQDTHDAQ